MLSGSRSSGGCTQTAGSLPCRPPPLPLFLHLDHRQESPPCSFSGFCASPVPIPFQAVCVSCHSAREFKAANK